MKLSLIVAVSNNGVIGKDGKLPWPKIPEDMANFRNLTLRNSVIMGRKTWESLGCPLDKRHNVVLSKTLKWGSLTGWTTLVRTPAQVLPAAFKEDDHAFIIGGAEIYRLFGPLCDEAHVTLVDRHVDGDTYFPDADIFCGWDAVEERQLADGIVYSRRIRKSCPNPITGDTSTFCGGCTPGPR